MRIFLFHIRIHGGVPKLCTVHFAPSISRSQPDRSPKNQAQPSYVQSPVGNATPTVALRSDPIRSSSSPVPHRSVMSEPEDRSQIDQPSLRRPSHNCSPPRLLARSPHFRFGKGAICPDRHGKNFVLSEWRHPCSKKPRSYLNDGLHDGLRNQV